MVDGVDGAQCRQEEGEKEMGRRECSVWVFV